ncbi:MAG: hypothetical protein AAGA30_00845 [Planctomycetota bacterium]
MRLALTFLLVVFCAETTFAQGTTYAFDLRTRDNFLSFPADDPVAIEFIDKNISPFALDFDVAGTTLYAVDSNTAQLGTLDQATGGFTAIAMLSGAFTGGTVTGLSADPTDGTFYMSTATDLYTLNVTTGATTLIGSFTPGLGTDLGTVIDIAINAAGEMFAHELDSGGGDLVFDGGLWSVDKTSGASTFIGNPGIEALFAQGMDFDPDTDLLYAAIYTGGGTGTYGTWDTTTGVVTTIAILPDFGEVELEMAVSGGVTYAFDFRGSPDSFFTFPVDNPLPVTSEVAVQNYATFALDFDTAGNLVIFDNGSNFFGTVDLDTGCFTPVAPRNGDLGVDPGGMSCDPTTGMFWLVAPGTNGDALYMADPTTGATTFVSDLLGGLGFLTGVVDLAIDNNGEFYIYDILEDALFRVDDPMTGATTLIGLPNVGDSNFAQGMDFDPTTNTLYQAIYTGGGTGSYGTWDLTSGVFTEILDLPSFLDPIGTGYELELAISEGAVLMGDVNCDGSVDLLDVAPFVDLITSGGFSAKADFTGDGMVTLLDVAPFVAALTGN